MTDFEYFKIRNREETDHFQNDNKKKPKQRHQRDTKKYLHKCDVRKTKIQRNI